MHKNKKLIPIISKKKHYKYYGLNLIGLMISSALGVFIISIIIKISITINNNLQLIAAYVELEQSARLIQKFFDNIFNANGYGISNPRTNDYFISNDGNTARFSMWYVNSINGKSDGSGSINNTISCSGRQLNITEGSTEENQIMVFLQNRSASGMGFITCRNATNPNTIGATPVTISTENPNTAMPLVDQNLIAKFFIAAIVKNKDNPKNHQIIPITTSNAGNTLASGNFSFGIKLGILLRSRKEVFNVNKNFTLDKILNVNDDNFKFTAKDDRFLYKLIIIQSPFSNNLTNNPPIMTTNIRQISTAIP